MSYADRWTTVRVEIDEGIAWVELNRPERMNAFSLALHEALGGDFRFAVERDGAERAVLGAKRVADPDPITAIGIRINHKLRRRAQLC